MSSNRLWGTVYGSDPASGGKFASQGVDVSTLKTTQSAALTLETAVSTSLAAAVTGSSGVGSMDRNVKTALSASYSSVTASIY